MISYAVVGEVVGANLFGAVGGSDLCSASFSDVADFFVALHIIKFRAQNFHRLFAVGMLCALFSATTYGARWLMSDAGGSFNFVHILSAGAAGAGKSNFQIV